MSIDTILTDALIESLFAPTERSEARALLANRRAMGLPLMNGPAVGNLERVRLAALKLSGGNLLQLRRAVDAANVDWRDVLVAAGFANGLSAHRVWADAVLHPDTS